MLYSLIHLKVHGQVLYIDACPIPPAGLVPAMYNLVYEKDDFSSLKRWLNKWILMNYSHLDCLRWCCVKTNTRERLPFSFSPKTRIFIEHLHPHPNFIFVCELKSVKNPRQQVTTPPPLRVDIYKGTLTAISEFHSQVILSSPLLCFCQDGSVLGSVSSWKRFVSHR